MAGRSPVDRGKQGLKRSVVTDGDRHPAAPGLGRRQPPRCAAARRRRSPGWTSSTACPTTLTVHLDRGYDGRPHARAARRARLRRRHRPQGRPGPDPGWLALGRGAHAQLDERLRQAPTLHREASGRSSTSTSSSPPPSSSSANSSSALASAIAGPPDPPPAASSSAYCRSLLAVIVRLDVARFRPEHPPAAANTIRNFARDSSTPASRKARRTRSRWASVRA